MPPFMYVILAAWQADTAIHYLIVCWTIPGLIINPRWMVSYLITLEWNIHYWIQKVKLTLFSLPTFRTHSQLAEFRRITFQAPIWWTFQSIHYGGSSRHFNYLFSSRISESEPSNAGRISANSWWVRVRMSWFWRISINLWIIAGE